jgi:hypothetical protein
MARIKSKNLFDLIKSLDKNEKRYFKLSCAGSGQSEVSKLLQLFDHINKQDHFDEDGILEKAPSIKASQLSNMKAYLYEKILQSIRQYNASKISDIKIREQIDFAQLLFARRLYTLGTNCLKKAKKMAKLQNNLELQLEIIKLEKAILSDGSEEWEHVDKIIAEARDINSQINNIHIFSNLSMKLNTFYRRIGYIRDESDYVKIKEVFYDSIPTYEEGSLSTTEKIHLYRLYIGYYFFIQDFDNGYLFAKKLEDIFEKNAAMIISHTEVYITSLNNMLTAQYKLFRYQEFLNTNKKLHSVKNMNLLHISESIRVRLLKYYFIHEINDFFMRGDFKKGVEFTVQENGEAVQQLLDGLDQHSSMILSYKIACLHFGAGNYSQSVRWLNKIINITNVDIREDLHCFARIMNLVCHYELGNFDVINYYIISTYRFLWKKEDLHLFQKYILDFLKGLNKQVDNKELLERFNLLKGQLLELENSDYEKRAFIYFDIISWLESKIEKRSVQEIIQAKFQKRIK